jgi:predicted porin
MKKTLVALAALAATSAFAQSSVTLSGVWDAGYKVTNAQDATASKKEVAGNNAGTTRLIFVGTEDLGGGLKAEFKGQALVNATSGQTGNAAATYSYSQNQNVFNDEMWIGLSGAFGSVKLGAPDSAQHQTSGQAQPFGTAMGSGWASSGVSRFGATTTTLGVNQFLGGASANGRVVRAEKAVRYDTPVFNGLSASYAYAAQNDNKTTAGDIGNSNGYSDIGVYYNNGPLKVSYANTSVKAGAYSASGNNATTAAAGALTANAELKTTFLAANYTVGALTVYAGSTTAKTTGLSTNLDVSSTNFAAKYALTPKVSVAANVVKIDDKASASATKDQTLTGLGLDYALSKRTTAYVRAEDYNTDKSLTTKGVKTYAVGFLHTF